MKRILTAGLLAGLALFVWEFIAHEFLPLGEAGFQALPNEAATLALMKGAIPQAGLYLFPAPEVTPGMTTAQKHDAMEKSIERSVTGPKGLMIFHPNGAPFSMPKSLGTQLGADIVAMWIAAHILSGITYAAGFGRRVILTVLMGFLPVLRTEIPYWNWYNYPAAYTLAQVTIHIAGFMLGGLILAKMVRGVPK
jgi:hypothetical protein